MKRDIRNGIEEYVVSELSYLNNLDRQKDEYDKSIGETVERIKTLVDLLEKEDVNISNECLENRRIDSTEIKNNSDVDLKREELNINIKKDVELRTDRIIKVIADVAVVTVPIIFYNVWMNKGFRFEETGTYTSNTFKNLFGKFKPNK